MKADLELRQDVERQLAWDPKIDATRIAVTAQNGVVTLTGDVRHYFDKREAESIAKSDAGRHCDCRRHRGRAIGRKGQ